jgi:anti-sigma-K factor RskA
MTMHEPDDVAPLRDDELDELRSLYERARGDVDWEAVPPDLWGRVAHGLAAAPQPPPRRSEHDGPVPSISAARRRWWFATAGVAAAAAATVAAVLIATDDEPGTEVLASVDLEPLGGSGSGRAELVRTDDTVQLLVETNDLGVPDGYFEVWLIDPSVTALVSLGPLRDDGEYDVPPGVDPAAFPIVDVSVEPVDGDPAHSGVSVLRGELPA